MLKKNTPRGANDAFALDKNAVRRRFSRSARSYDQVAVLQRTAVDRLVERLQYIKFNPSVILDAGSGTGYGGRRLLEHYPKAKVIQLDIAHGMLRHAQQQTGWMQRLRKKHAYLCADIENLPLADQSVDMVFSSFALQWCGDLDRAFKEFQRVLKPDGLLMFSSLGPDTLKELRQSWAAVDNLTHVNAFIDMHDVGDALVRAQFATPVMDVEVFTLTYQDVNAITRDLKDLGSRNATRGRSTSLTGKRKWQQMNQSYERFRRENVLPATYEVVFGHAWGRGFNLLQGQGAKPVIPIPVRVTGR